MTSAPVKLMSVVVAGVGGGAALPHVLLQCEARANPDV